MRGKEGYVALVGRRLPHNENLGLGYLAAALRQAGYEPRRFYVHDEPGLRAALDAFAADPPAVLGLSLSDGGSALWSLALGEAMHRRGFRGHITSGGQFATLARRWLLDRYRWLDSVVRFAGERPLVELLRTLDAGGDPASVPGVTTRAGDGPPAPVLDDTPLTLVPERDQLPEVLGHPAAHITASRGCAGRCHYCGPAALHALEREEGRAGGASLPVMNARGVGGQRRRDVEAVCDEMATLWHERGVRYFYFVDEHLLPYREADALDVLSRWRQGLDRRGVGPLGIGAMLRTDRITAPVIDAFRDVGLVRCFVGLELSGPAEARRFGRPGPSDRDLALIEHFARRDIATVSNLMLLNPCSTPETIGAGLDLLERLPSGVFEATRMMVYHGTRLHDRLAAEGRLLGNPFRYGYTFDDPRMERFAEVFSRLRGEAFQDYSVAYRAHDAHLSLALARRVAPRRIRDGVEWRLDRARRDVNALYVEAYRRGLALALEGGGFHEATPLVREMRRRTVDLEERLDDLDELLLTEPRRRNPLFAPMRAAAAGALSFVMMGAPGCSCSESHTRSGEDAAVRDAGRDAAVPDGGECTDAARMLGSDRVRDVALAAEACFSGAVRTDPLEANFNAEWWGDARYTPCFDSDPFLAERTRMEDAVESALSGRVPECVEPYVSVEGGAASDMQRLGEAASGSCAVGLDRFRIVLDASGAVADVISESGSTETEDCVRAALAGLTFPCLASFEVCPEYAIAE